MVMVEVYIFPIPFSLQADTSVQYSTVQYNKTGPCPVQWDKEEGRSRRSRRRDRKSELVPGQCRGLWTDLFLEFFGVLLPENGDVERKSNFWNFMYIF